MEKLLSDFRASFFTDPLCTLTALICLIILSSRPVEKRLKGFKLYFAGYLCLTLTSYFSTIMQANRYSDAATLVRIQQHVDFAFTILEFHVFTYSLKDDLSGKTVSGLTKLFWLSAVGVYAYALLESGQLLDKHNLLIFTFQAIFLLILCGAYYFSIFKDRPILNWREEPSFWIATGLTFFMLSTLPYSISSIYIYHSNFILFSDLYTIFYIFYILLFCMIIRASRCKPAKPQ